MRIIAGKYRGRRLATFKADHIRPTTDRVKESVFNKLQGEISGARVLDLFSGTGNLSFEALSRGAISVEAVELSKQSIAIIRENAALLGVALGSELTLCQSDVMKWLARYQGPAFDLVFIDPPFTKKIAHEALAALAGSAAMGSTTIAIIEASSHERVDDSYGFIARYDSRDYGDKQISFFGREEKR